jgi:hypothetical protein
MVSKPNTRPMPAPPMIRSPQLAFSRLKDR